MRNTAENAIPKMLSHTSILPDKKQLLRQLKKLRSQGVEEVMLEHTSAGWHLVSVSRDPQAPQSGVYPLGSIEAKMLPEVIDYMLRSAEQNYREWQRIQKLVDKRKYRPAGGRR